MRQTRLCSFFNHARSNACSHHSPTQVTFLDLPESLRWSIYAHADVPTGGTCFLDMAEPMRPSDPYVFHQREFDGNECCRALRLVSHGIKTDIARFLCANNKVEVRACQNAMLYDVEIPRSHNPHFAALSGMPPELGRSIRCLSVNIHDTQRVKIPLSSTSKEFAGLLAQWRTLVKGLARVCDLDRLRLELSCDVADVATAQLLVEPLMTLRVASCTIRLGRQLLHPKREQKRRESGRTWSYGNDLQARDAIQRAAKMGVLACSVQRQWERASFDFLRLPPELRLHILSYTDLILPDGQVECSPDSRYRLVYCRSKAGGPENICSAPAYCQHDFCGYTTCTRPNYCHPGFPDWPPCDCWSPPTSLFLACKTMLRDARAVFFSSNRFTATSPSCYKPTAGPGDMPFEAATFLQDLVPRDCLASLRCLELIFPPTTYTPFGFTDAVLQDWSDTMHLLSQHARHLKLRLYFGYDHVLRMSKIATDNVNDARKRLMQTHDLIARPIKQIGACLDSLLVCTAFKLVGHDEGVLDFEGKLEELIVGCECHGVKKAMMKEDQSKWLEEEDDDDVDRSYWTLSRPVRFVAKVT